MLIVAGIAAVGIVALVATWWLWPRTNSATTGAVGTGMTQASPSATTPGGPTAAPIDAVSATRAPTASIAIPPPAPSAATVSIGSQPGSGGVATNNAPPTRDASAAGVETPVGHLLISAVGLADPSDPRYAHDKALLQTDVRTDSRQQLVEKALVLLLDRKSFTSNYDVLQTRVVARSGDFIGTIVREGQPQLGKDGLLSMTTQAVVNVKAVQRSLNQLSRDERMNLIRANGDPRIAVRVAVRDADHAETPAQPSPIAENILKERIKSFGFRTWSDEAAGSDGRGADFIVTGEASVKRLSTRLAASGLVITKYALSSWTVKCANRVTGEEIYFNTTLPQGLGSWASEEEALRVIGAKVADQFSRDLFLQHVDVTGRKITLIVTGMPDATSEELLAHELIGLPAVMSAFVGPPGSPRVYDLSVAASGAPSEAIAANVVAPLNAKLGQVCFSVGSVEGTRVSVGLDPKCTDGMLRARLETNPPAGLYGAPPARQKAIIKNPDTLRKLV
jgi:serine/threonine-protein kinase